MDSVIRLRSFVDAIRIEFLHSSSVSVKALKGRLRTCRRLEAPNCSKLNLLDSS